MAVKCSWRPLDIEVVTVAGLTTMEVSEGSLPQLTSEIKSPASRSALRPERSSIENSLLFPEIQGSLSHAAAEKPSIFFGGTKTVNGHTNSMAQKGLPPWIGDAGQ
jgi:hypothetical protein